MIQSFKCKDTELLFTQGRSGRFGNISRPAMRKLLLLDAATTLGFLRAPPGNRLEALSGDRAGQHSIRIHEQFRLCFVWSERGPEQVEIVDYH